MPLLNYTTSVSAEKTVGEIEAALAKAGASHVLKEFDQATGLPCGLVFGLQTQHGPLTFRLPARFGSAVKVLNRQASAGKIPRRYLNDRAQAIRVSWRIVLQWTLAQLAIIELEQADATELFLAYAVTNDGRTVADRIHATGLFLK